MKAFQRIYVLIFTLTMYMPIVYIVVNSFNKSRNSIHWNSFSLQWYYDIFYNHSILLSIRNSITLALISSLLSVLSGIIIGFSTYKYHYMYQKILEYFIQIMISFPDILIGTSLLITYSFFNIELNFLSLIISHFVLCFPFAATIIKMGFRKINLSTIEAAYDLGAEDIQIIRLILLPLIKTNIISALLTCFMLSFDDIVVSYFIAGPQYELLPLKLYSMIRIGIKPSINAICTLLIIVALITCMIIIYLQNKKYDD